MNNKQLQIADTLLRRCFKEVIGTSLLEMKYKRFEEVKYNLYSALKLMDVDVSEIKPKRRLTPDLLIEIFDNNYPEWRTMRRQRRYLIPRQMLQYFLSIKTGLVLKEIGKITGGFDHTTVIHSRNAVVNMLKTKQIEFVLIFKEVNDIINSITGEEDVDSPPSEQGTLSQF